MIRATTPPASTPDKDEVYQRAAILKSWGLKVDFGEHIFRKQAFLAGTDDERLADFNAALRDPTVRAIFATRGGKGSYRIADRLDFEAARKDPKFVIGFSDITMLHLSLQKHCGLVCIHGALMADEDGTVGEVNREALRRALMVPEPVTVASRPDEPTSALTTGGTVEGTLIGGNLDMVSTAAGWALPDLKGAILLLEAVNMHIGQVDRQLTMLRKAGHLDGVTGIALGQFTGVDLDRRFSIIDLLREHLDRLAVPVLGGLPLGHGRQPLSIPVGEDAILDTSSKTLTVGL
ncbi:LD-carboxypeptidase [Rhizobium ruizarguesonis]|uniref:S66 peptidase family protein n=1 Tax=Rhizobium ruizarguesonis TaxID=2081791 RepID=UPI003718C447